MRHSSVCKTCLSSDVGTLGLFNCLIPIKWQDIAALRCFGHCLRDLPNVVFVRAVACLQFLVRQIAVMSGQRAEDRLSVGLQFCRRGHELGQANPTHNPAIGITRQHAGCRAVEDVAWRCGFTGADPFVDRVQSCIQDQTVIDRAE